MCIWTRPPVAKHTVRKRKPLTAYKVLGAPRMAENGWLYSPHQGTTWIGGVCLTTDIGLGGGVYSFKEKAAAERYARRTFAAALSLCVIAEIAIWGTVWEYATEWPETTSSGYISLEQHGYRSSRARVLGTDPIPSLAAAA